MKHSLCAFATLALFGLLSSACVSAGYHVGVMARLYRRGDCVGALERAAKIQDRVSGLPVEKQAHYYIYRGACLVRLRQPQEAQVALDQALRLRAAYPGVITPEHDAVLGEAVAGLAQLGVTVGAPPPPTVQVPPGSVIVVPVAPLQNP